VPALPFNLSSADSYATFVVRQLVIALFPGQEIGTLMTALKLVTLSPLMARTAGRPEVAFGLIDGPVAIGHPDLESESIRELPVVNGSSCALSSSAACN